MTQDRWSEWLLQKRFGGDQQAAEAGMRMLLGVRDAVLKRADLHAGDTLLDVGAGDGLIAFGGLDRVGPAGRVIFADISQPLLEHAQRLAQDMGVSERCSFVNAHAEDLNPLDDASVDAVTTRSVLIYVKDKSAAFREFHRVLKPGGRLSLWEPINRFTELFAPGQYWGPGVEGLEALAERLQPFYGALQPLDSDPMLDFDERDLLRQCEEAGFRYVRVTLSMYTAPARPASWAGWLNTSGNPNIPSRADAMRQLFTDDERALFESLVRPRIETGGQIERSAVAHLVAVKDGGARPPDLMRGA
ncbi:MAG: methyltransferase domain-containing protein [Chloroflexota bacterium]|nr:methyltransferase domain-containing protein [Chloroflexota bacterium]